MELNKLFKLKYKLIKVKNITERKQIHNYIYAYIIYVTAVGVLSSHVQAPGHKSKSAMSVYKNEHFICDTNTGNCYFK